MIQERVISAIKSVFPDDSIEIMPHTVAADVQGWDSFNHINVIMAVEDEFEISFSTEEIGKLGTVGDLMSSVEKKISNDED